MRTHTVVRTLAGALGTILAVGCSSVPRADDTRVAPPRRTDAQVQTAGVAQAPSRRELEARAAQLERDPRRRAEAVIVRNRLREGDLQVGDAIVLEVVGVQQFTDTFPVRAGRVLQLPEVPPIPLAGVLRSELTSHLRRQIGRYVINPTVSAYSLVRVAVAGGVAAPGFYDVRPDAPLTEAVMRAGGLAAAGDATKISVRRAGRTLIPEAEVRNRLAAGATLDDLSIRAGDEVRVGERRQRDWLDVIRTVAYVAVLATGIWAGGQF